MPETMNELTTEEQIKATKFLLQQFDMSNVALVQDLELPTPRDDNTNNNSGAFTEDALRGYGFLMQCYKMLHYDDFTPSLEKTFDKNIDIIRQLQEDRAFLRTIHDTHNDLLNNQDYQQNERENYPYHAALQEHIESKYATLQTIGEVYMLGGFNGHHEIIKLERHGAVFHQTTYNAGTEAIASCDDNSQMMGICKRLFRSPTEERLKEHIRTIAEKKIRQWEPDHPTSSKNYYTLYASLEQSLDAIIAHTDVPPQQKSNCTTRSTREFLRDQLDGKRFESLYNFVYEHSAETHYSLLQDHLNKLEAEQERLPNLNRDSLQNNASSWQQRVQRQQSENQLGIAV